MDRLYTPWRLAYVTEASIVTPECVFCAALAAGDREPLIIHRGRRTFVILNKFPYNNGHLLVVPRAHAATLAELGDEDSAATPAQRKHASPSAGGLPAVT